MIKIVKKADENSNHKLINQCIVEDIVVVEGIKNRQKQFFSNG